MLHFLPGKAGEIRRGHSLRQYSHRADVRATSPRFSGWSRNTHTTGRPPLDRLGSDGVRCACVARSPSRMLRAMISSFRNIGCKCLLGHRLPRGERPDCRKSHYAAGAHDLIALKNVSYGLYAHNRCSLGLLTRKSSFDILLSCLQIATILVRLGSC